MLKFFAEKMWVAFAVQKLLTFFSAKNIGILYIESAKIVNEMTLNELVKLTTLWTTGPCWLESGNEGLMKGLMPHIHLNSETIPCHYHVAGAGPRSLVDKRVDS